ncbi:hypothetical protein SANTM175S_04464 [Streptomyces antimycoticus]
MDGSATVVRSDYALHGTDDVSDDVTQDAVLIFAKRLGEIVATCEVSAVWIDSREPCAWQYVRRDGETIIVTRKTLHYWAVRDAAARNGYRMDVKPEEDDATPGKQVTRGIPHADKLTTLAVTPYLSGNSETIFRSAWGDGNEYPTLRRMLRHASNADDLGRSGAIGKTGARDVRWPAQFSRPRFSVRGMLAPRNGVSCPRPSTLRGMSSSIAAHARRTTTRSGRRVPGPEP